MARDRHAETKPPPGVIEAAPPFAATPRAAAHSPSGYWRVHIYLPTTPEAGAPDHVVAARDAIEAEARCYEQLGIRSVDKSVNTVEITAATEAEFIMAQARRLGVDLRQQRQLKRDDGTELAEDDADYGKLTWTPPGGTLEKGYFVSRTGEVLTKKEEKEA